MKRIVAIFLFASILLSCSFATKERRNNLSGDSLKIEKNHSTNGSKSLANIDGILNYFNRHQSEIKRTEIDLSWEDTTNFHPDKGALLYKIGEFNVLQVITFGTIGKKELNILVKDQNIFHIQQINYQYNHPYYLPNFKIIRSDTLDFYLNNKKITTVRNNRKIINLNEKLEKEGYLILSEGEKILGKEDNKAQ